MDPLIFFIYVVLVVVLCVLEQVHLLRVLVCIVVAHVRQIICWIRSPVHLMVAIIVVILVVQQLYAHLMVLRAPITIAIIVVMKLLVLICVINFVLVGQRINLDAGVIIYAIIAV